MHVSRLQTFSQANALRFGKVVYLGPVSADTLGKLCGFPPMHGFDSIALRLSADDTRQHEQNHPADILQLPRAVFNPSQPQANDLILLHDRDKQTLDYLIGQPGGMHVARPTSLRQFDALQYVIQKMPQTTANLRVAFTDTLQAQRTKFIAKLKADARDKIRERRRYTADLRLHEGFPKTYRRKPGKLETVGRLIQELELLEKARQDLRKRMQRWKPKNP